MIINNKRIHNTNQIMSIIILLASCAIIINLFSSGIIGNDFWWHIKVGEYISDNHLIPDKDIFSWIGMEKGISWTAHEWLSELIFFFVYTTCGSIGVFLVSFGLALIIMILLWKETKKCLSNNIIIVGLFLVLFAVLTKMFFYGRPHVFGFFLLFFELKILYHFILNPTSKSIYMIPIIAILWSNLHGGSSNLSYILCLIFLIVGIFSVKIGKIKSNRLEKRSLIILGIITFLTIIAIFLNPVGLKVFIYPYQSFADSISMTSISEWQAPDAKMLDNLLFYFLPIAFISTGIMAYENDIELIDIVIMSLFLILFFRSSRFIIMWYIAAVFYGIKYMPKCNIKAINYVWEKISVIMCIVLLLGSVGYGIYNSIKMINDGKIIRTAMSDEAVLAIKKDKPKRIFNDYDVGETLIYNEIPVFFDGRADLFAQDSIMADGMSMVFLGQMNKQSKKQYVNVDEMIEKYKFDSIVILKKRPLYTYIISHPEMFQTIYEDVETAYYRIKY